MTVNGDGPVSRNRPSYGTLDGPTGNLAGIYDRLFVIYNYNNYVKI